MKQKLFLHIGTEKTGTTTLQETLYRNYDLLKKYGILYPKSLGLSNHVGFCVSFQSKGTTSELNAVVNSGVEEEDIKRYRANTLATLKNEILSSDCETVIISNEHLHSRIFYDTEVADIKNWLSGLFEDRVVIVCYLRRQSDLAVSHFSTAIKSGSTEHRLKLPNHKTHYYDYRHMLEMWSKYFPNIQCREYHLKKLKNRDIVDDFLSLLPIEFSGELQRVQNANVSLDGKALEVLALMNRGIPFLTDNKINPERRYLVNFFKQIPIKKKVSLNNRELQNFQAQFTSDNQYISREFCKTDKLFHAAAPQEENYIFGLQKEDIQYVFSEFWKVTSLHLNFLEARNLYLKGKISFLKNDLCEALFLVRESLKISRLPKAIALEKKILRTLNTKESSITFRIASTSRQVHHSLNAALFSLYCTLIYQINQKIQPLVWYFYPKSTESQYAYQPIRELINRCGSSTVCRKIYYKNLTLEEILQEISKITDTNHSHTLNDEETESFFFEFWSVVFTQIKETEQKNTSLKKQIFSLQEKIDDAL